MCIYLIYVRICSPEQFTLNSSRAQGVKLMKYSGGTITESTEARVGKSSVMGSIEGSISVVTLRGRKFTLHRVDQSQPAAFYMTFDVHPGRPILADENDEFAEPYAVFTVDGGVITEGDWVRLIAEDGSTEMHIVKKFDVHPRPRVLPAFMRNGRKSMRTGRSTGRPRKLSVA